MQGYVFIEAKSRYGKVNIHNHGTEYKYIKIVEHIYNGDFLILIQSIKDDARILVNVEHDKDFTIKFFKN